MKRVGVYTKVLTAAESIVARTSGYAFGELSLLATDGEALELGATGPYKRGTMVDIVVGTKENPREIITINPYSFNFERADYSAAVGQTVVLGSSTEAGKLIVEDPTVLTNMNKIGTLSLIRKTLDSGVVAPWGDTFVEDVQIRPGDTTATVLAKLVAVATKMVAEINAKYGAGTVTLTSDIAGANKHVTFAFAPGKTFNVALDGIFDGTKKAMTIVGDIHSGLTGAEVRSEEEEAAVMDGYNPVQLPKYQQFDLETYHSASVGTNYDAILITTTLPKQYETPGSPDGWDVVACLYGPTEDRGATNSLEAILKELKKNHQGLTLADLVPAP